MHLHQQYRPGQKQSGFVPAGFAAVVIAVVIAVGGGYFILTRSKDEPVSSVTIPEVTLSTVADGTPENTFNAIDEQLMTETELEDDSAISETDESEFNTRILDEYEELADESRL